MKYAIYPPIGIARIGNSEEFFIGPEKFGSMGIQIDNNGDEHEVISFKDEDYKTKKQGARFRIFEVPEGDGEPRPMEIPEGANIKWKVTVANKKDAIIRPSSPPDFPRSIQLGFDKI